MVMMEKMKWDEFVESVGGCMWISTRDISSSASPPDCQLLAYIARLSSSISLLSNECL